MNSRGYIPPLAFFAIVVLVGLVVITMLPGVKETVIQILEAFSGN